jgi:hypothetical protein
MSSGQTCQLAILLKLYITFNYNGQENATPPYKQQHVMTMYKLLSNPQYTNIICKVVHLTMVLIRMNYY